MKELSSVCGACVAIIGTIKKLIRISGTKKILTKLAIAACIRYKYGGNETCTLTINAHRDHFHKVLSESNLTSMQMCQRLDFCEMPSEFDKFREAPIYPVKPFIGERGIFSGVHLSDVHIDPLYKVGSNKNCKEILCCRDNEHNQSAVNAASMFGEANCDLPKVFFSKHFVEKFLNENDVVLLTGDVGAHDVWNVDYEELLMSHRIASSSLLKGHKVFFSLGNHDLIPANYFPYGPNSNATGNLLKDLKSIWKLPEIFEKGGYYKEELNNWCIISLNSLFYYPDNDPEEQLTYLYSQLMVCSPKPVIILTHGPPGTRDHSIYYNQQLTLLFKNYPNAITILSGHTHTDYFSLIGEKAVNFITPSLTTWKNWTSSVRRIDFKDIIGN